jgi:hypothetical protein
MLLLKPMYRVITFVPPEYLAGVLESIRRIIPLRYGQYDSVAWWSAEGTEQFRPLAGANPTVGKELAIPISEFGVCSCGLRVHPP